MDQLRYFLGVANMLVLPLGLLYWSVIHRWAHSWRKLGPTRTYVIVLPVLIALGALLFRFRPWLLGADLGTNRYLIAIAIVFYVASTWVDWQCWKRLSITTAVGIPELSSPERQGRLLQDGIYRVIRHPRYLSAGIGVIGNTLLINYTGMYVLILILFLLGYPMLLLEERELVQRFGEEYRRYQREVPLLFPRFRRPV
jgi:protein-S-isoprenylcysteine O-methyltransferase Ste14